MNDVVNYTNAQLPDTLEDLTQFVLVGKAKLQAYMLKLQTVNKLSTAQEIRDQTLKEAQEISTALIAAEQRIGELLLAIPKATAQNNPSGKSGTQNRDESKLGKTKTETVKEMGYSKDEASDYQQMAKNPEIVQKVIEDALANGEIVTKTSVMREIKFYKDRIEELKNKKPEVVTKTVEVVPDDYEDLKKSKEASLKDYQYLEKERQKDLTKIRELQQRIDDLETRKDINELQKKLEEEAGYFSIRTYDYIKKNGGFVWITERMEQLPEKQRKEFISTVYAIDAFAKQMVQNIGGYGIE